jgi:hypothetical protein
MNYSQFTSNQGWINFQYPSNLISTEEQEGTYLFYTEQTGSFRITPLLLEGRGDFDADAYLKKMAGENKVEILKNQFNNYVYYISYSKDDAENLTIYNWIFSVDNKIVYCSYTIDTESTNEPEIDAERKEIFKIIENLNIT